MILTRIRQALTRRPIRSGRMVPSRLGLEEFEPRLVPACTTPPAQCFLSQLYRDVLGREIDATGLNGWTQALSAGLTREQVALAITRSQDFRVLMVERAYNQYLGRTADQTGLNTFTALLANGGSLEQIHAIIIGSPEYSLLGNNASASGFLRSVYRDVLGRAIDQAGETAFTLLLVTGASRASVALTLLTSVERASNLVQGFYSQFLGRTGESAGLTVFVNALRTGARQEQVISIFVGSAEYFQRL